MLSVRFTYVTRHVGDRCQFAPPTLRDLAADVVSSLHIHYATRRRSLSVFFTYVTRHAAKKRDHAGKIARAARHLHNSVHRRRISALRYTHASGLPRVCRKGLRSCAQEPECVRYVSGLMCCKTASPSVCTLVKPFPAARVALTCAAYVRLFYAKPLSDLAQNYSLSRSIAWVGYFLVVGSAFSALVVDSTSTAEPTRVSPSG